MPSEFFELNGYDGPFVVASSDDAKQARLDVVRAVKSPPLVAGQNAGRNRHVQYKTLAAMAASPTIVDAIQPLLGETIVLWQSQVWDKSQEGAWARDGAEYEIPWHRDVDTLAIEGETVSVWVALDPVSADNGGVELMPGSHKFDAVYQPANPAIHAPQFKNMLDTSGYDMSKAVLMTLNPGEGFSFADKTWHSSGANLSGLPRTAVAFRYCGADAVPKRADPVCLSVTGEKPPHFPFMSA